MRILFKCGWCRILAHVSRCTMLGHFVRMSLLQFAWWLCWLGSVAGCFLIKNNCRWYVCKKRKLATPFKREITVQADENGRRDSTHSIGLLRIELRMRSKRHDQCFDLQLVASFRLLNCRSWIQNFSSFSFLSRHLFVFVRSWHTAVLSTHTKGYSQRSIDRPLPRVVTIGRLLRSAAGVDSCKRKSVFHDPWSNSQHQREEAYH